MAFERPNVVSSPLFPFSSQPSYLLLWEALRTSGSGPGPQSSFLPFILTGLAVTSLPTIAIAYATECYSPISGDIIVVVTVIKDVYGFAISFIEPPLVRSYGYLGGACIQGSTVFAFLIMALMLYI